MPGTPPPPSSPSAVATPPVSTVAPTLNAAAREARKQRLEGILAYIKTSAIDLIRAKNTMYHAISQLNTVDQQQEFLCSIYTTLAPLPGQAIPLRTALQDASTECVTVALAALAAIDAYSAVLLTQIETLQQMKTKLEPPREWLVRPQHAGGQGMTHSTCRSPSTPDSSPPL